MPVVHLGDAQVGIEPPQPADRQLLLVVHAAGEEAAAAVALAVVQARARLLGVDELRSGRACRSSKSKK